MMRFRKLAVLSLTAALAVSALTGCSSFFQQGDMAKSVAATAAAVTAPDMQKHDDITLDFDAAQDECEELLRDEDYKLVSYIDTYVDEDSKTVNLIMPLVDDAKEKDGLTYAKAFVRAFNDACAEQDFSIDASTEDSYGGLYKKYAFNVQVFREADILKPESYFVSQTVEAGANDKLVLFSQYDGVNKVELSDGPAWVPGGKYTGGLDGVAQKAGEDAEAHGASIEYDDDETDAEETSAAAASAAETEPIVGPGAKLQNKQ